LVVAATGTGKTIVAALDYKRLREELKQPSLLFVAHRKELLGQTPSTSSWWTSSTMRSPRPIAVELRL
jgi:superfamily II DNA or RNA helicase